MSPSPRKGGRGQALVETTLGLIVFITILIFGIYFGELTTLQMKVTEAAASANWDATAGQMHRIPFSYNDVDRSVRDAAKDANQRYADFDGRMAVNWGAGPTQVFTTARNLRVRCRMGAGMSFRASNNPMIWGIYRDNNGGMSCEAEARVGDGGASDWGSFLEGGDGFFQASQKDSAAFRGAGMRVCSMGRPDGLNGPCTGTMSMLMDDWGLANAQREDRPCPVVLFGIPCPNINYWTATSMLYTLNSKLFGTANNADYNLIRGAYGSVPFPRNPGGIPIPATPTGFYMSFTGEDASSVPFSGFTPWAGDGSWLFWQTTPFAYPAFYKFAYNAGTGCYLGRDCNNSNVNAP